MSLAERVSKPPTNNHNRCGVANLFDSMPDGEADALRKMFDDSRWSSPNIYKALVAEEFDIPRRSVERHRRGDCGCAKENNA